MDRNSPEFYTASCQANLDDSRKFIDAVRCEHSNFLQSHWHDSHYENNTLLSLVNCHQVMGGVNL